MKGTIWDFLELVSETPELAQRLGQLASEYGFEFTDEELSAEELGQVAGGTTVDGTQSSEMTNLSLNTDMDRQAKMVQTLSNIMKKINTTQDGIISNIK